MASDDVRVTASMAAAWYYLPAMFDALSAPTRWVWDDNDKRVNDMLNFRVGAEAGAISEWRAQKGRRPANAEDTDWEPRYFPDDPWTLEVAGAKHAFIMEESRRRKDAIADILDDTALATRIDHDGVLDALSSGFFLFSPAQYVTIVEWMRSSVPDFARAPETRSQIFRMWSDAPLLTDPEHAERAQSMLRGGSLYRVSKKTGARLGEIMRGELPDPDEASDAKGPE